MVPNRYVMPKKDQCFLLKSLSLADTDFAEHLLNIINPAQELLFTCGQKLEQRNDFLYLGAWIVLSETYNN